MSMAQISIQLRNKSQGVAVKDTAFTLPLGVPHITVLLGPSGAGKTSILRYLAGLSCPYEGSITYQDEVWINTERHLRLSPQQRDLSYLAQDFPLFPHLDVAANIGFGLRSVTPRARADRIDELLSLVELGNFSRRPIQNLSGGERQRVALARTLARPGRLVLLDEPLAALDTPLRLRLRAKLRQALRQSAIPAVIVTHDRVEALALADYILIFDHGTVVDTGAAAEVFARPRGLAAALAVGIETVVSGSIVYESGGLAEISVGAVQLSARCDFEAPSSGAPVFVLIRAEDIVLTKDTPSSNTALHATSRGIGSSARNQLPGLVTSLTNEGPTVRVDLDCGFPLTAYITRSAREDLELLPGDAVKAIFKASAVHFIAR